MREREVGGAAQPPDRTKGEEEAQARRCETPSPRAAWALGQMPLVAPREEVRGGTHVRAEERRGACARASRRAARS
jgi:hypothetical protein